MRLELRVQVTKEGLQIHRLIFPLIILNHGVDIPVNGGVIITAAPEQTVCIKAEVHIFIGVGQSLKASLGNINNPVEGIRQFLIKHFFGFVFTHVYLPLNRTNLIFP